jgi:hypothetical protein
MTILKFKRLTTIGLTSASLIADDSKSFSNQVEGEWISYGQDQFNIKKISENKVETTFYDIRTGNFLFKRTAHLELKNSVVGERKKIIGAGETWQYLAGKEPVDSSWTGLSFDAEAKGWKAGPAGFGYGDDDDKTVLADMEGKYRKIFIRKEFDIADDTEFERLALLIDYDDAFVLHVNGRRLLSSKSVVIDEKTGEVTVTLHEAGNPEYVPLSPFAGAFKTGKNVIAIEGHNAELDSSDFSLDPQLIMGSSGSFIETQRSEKHASADTDHYFNDRLWNGLIDNLRIWERALSGSEVSELWDGGKGTSRLSPEVSKSLIGYWPFDGNLKDMSGNARHGKGYGNPQFEEAKLGKGLSLDGENDYVSLGGKVSDYTPKSGSVSISLWFTAKELDKTFQTLVSLGDDNMWNDWRIHRAWDNENLGYIGGGGVVNQVNINDGKLHHVVAVSEKGKGLRLYVDNKVVVNNPDNAKRGIALKTEGLNPVVGANLQKKMDLAKPLLGKFVPMQGKLRVYSDANFSPQWRNGTYSGLYHKVSEPNEVLKKSSRDGDLETVKKLLASGVDPNTILGSSHSALADAAMNGHIKIMELLIAAGADVNALFRSTHTPLSMTAGTSEVEAAKLLIKHGANINSLMGKGSSIAHEAAYFGHPKMLKFVLSQNKDLVNMRDKQGGTILHYAMNRMRAGDDERNRKLINCVKIALKNGADPKLESNWQDSGSAIKMAKDRRLYQVTDLLEK